MHGPKTLVVFAGGEGDSRIEETLGIARQALALDLIEKATQPGLFDRAILNTDDLYLAKQARTLGARTRITSESFHFGESLRECIRDFGVEKALYVGAGAAALARDEELATLSQILDEDKVVAPNNLYSADLVAWSPGSAIQAIEPPATDNDLAWRLHYAAGLPLRSLPPTLEFGFDIDTPIDLTLLKLSGAKSDRLESLFAQTDIPTNQVQKVVEVMADPTKQILVAGRVSLPAWVQFQHKTAAATRLLSEERGMRASGRLERGEARSLLGFLAKEDDFKYLFDALAQLSDAVILDSRVIFAHLGLEPLRSDRYAADMLALDEIAEPRLRRFAEAAAACDVPVIMGGHSLVSAGLSLLVRLMQSQASYSAPAEAYKDVVRRAGGSPNSNAN